MLTIRWTVNPHDNLIRDFAYFVGKENLPGVLAIDIIGEIVKLGQDVTAFKVGDAIMGLGDPALPDNGGLQEFAILDADFISKLPTSISPDQAATMILNVVTAYGAVLTSKALGIPSPLSASAKNFDYKNSSIAIIGANSACGKFAIQLAKWAGMGTIIAVAGASAKADLLAMGATHCIDRSLSEEDIQNEVRGIMGDNLLYSLDCINREDHTPGVSMLSNTKRGTFVPLAGRLQDTVDKARAGEKQQGYNFNRFVARPSLFREEAKLFFKAWPKLIDDGVLTPTSFEVVEGFDVDRIDKQLDGWRDRTWPTRVNVHVT